VPSLARWIVNVLPVSDVAVTVYESVPPVTVVMLASASVCSTVSRSVAVTAEPSAFSYSPSGLSAAIVSIAVCAVRAETLVSASLALSLWLKKDGIANRGQEAEDQHDYEELDERSPTPITPFAELLEH